MAHSREKAGTRYSDIKVRGTFGCKGLVSLSTKTRHLRKRSRNNSARVAESSSTLPALPTLDILNNNEDMSGASDVLIYLILVHSCLNRLLSIRRFHKRACILHARKRDGNPPS